MNRKYNISQIPVLEKNKIIGSIHESTIIDSISKKGDFEKIFSSNIYNIMETKFLAVRPKTPIDDVVLLFSQGESAVLVMDDDKIIGIITKIDAISSTIDIKKT